VVGFSRLISLVACGSLAGAAYLLYLPLSCNFGFHSGISEGFPNFGLDGTIAFVALSVLVS